MYAFATLLTSDSYLPGALTLAHSLRSHNTQHDICVLVPPTALSQETLAALYRIFTKVIYVAELTSGAAEGLELLGRPELGVTFTKLHVFDPSVMAYERVVFMDADSFVLRNVDELFDYLNEGACFAAAADVGWPDIFNSGVFCARPSTELFSALIAASENGSFDGGDQGLLNSFFSSWSGFSYGVGAKANSQFRAVRLPFIFNLTPSAVYSYLPAYMRFRDDVAVVHFAGTIKPWRTMRFSDGSVRDQQTEAGSLHGAWWRVYDALMEKWRQEYGNNLGMGESGLGTSFGGFGVDDSGASRRYMRPPTSNPTEGALGSIRYDWNASEVDASRPLSPTADFEMWAMTPDGTTGEPPNLRGRRSSVEPSALVAPILLTAPGGSERRKSKSMQRMRPTSPSAASPMADVGSPSSSTPAPTPSAPSPSASASTPTTPPRLDGAAPAGRGRYEWDPKDLPRPRSTTPARSPIDGPVATPPRVETVPSEDYLDALDEEGLPFKATLKEEGRSRTSSVSAEAN
ncbi:Glycogenin-2 [Irineochytrium annulatum]|nr:Glycogenin-2 [Irineochytrium annulatum]